MKIIGHRGARGLAPENTIKAIEKALDHTVDMIEVDLRVTKDNIVILHHDADLREPNGTRHHISTSNEVTLRRIKADLATLDELFMSLQTHKDTGLYLEVKPGVNIQPIVATIEAYIVDGFQPANVWLGSKSQAILQALHLALPDHPTIVIEGWNSLRATRRAHALNTRLIAMNQQWLWWGFIRSMSRRSWQLYAYDWRQSTSPATARHWERSGLAGVITDYPNRFEKQ